MNIARILKRAGTGALLGAIAIIYLISVVSCVTSSRKPVPQPRTSKKQARIPSPPKKPKQVKKKLPSTVLFQNLSDQPVLVKLSGPMTHVAYIEPQKYTNFKALSGDYQVRIRSGKIEPYYFAENEVFPLQQPKSVIIEIDSPQKNTTQWHKIDEAEFYRCKPRVGIVTGCLVNINRVPIEKERLYCSPYKDGKMKIVVGLGGTLMNPTTTIGQNDHGRFALFLNLDAEPQYDEFIFSLKGINGPLLKDEEGKLVVFKVFNETIKPYDIGTVIVK